MSVRVTVVGGGASRLAEKYNRAANFLGAAGMRRVLKEKGDEAVEIFKQNILRSSPGDLQDLKEPTKERKRKLYGSEYPILKATGQMMESMFSYIALTSAGWVMSIRFRGERNRIIADAHINGKGNLPPRDFMKLPRSFRAGVFSAIRAGLRR